MICPNCQTTLKQHTTNSTWFYCLNVQCKLMINNDYHVGIHTNQKDFMLPLPKYLIAISNYDNGYIRIGNIAISNYDNGYIRIGNVEAFLFNKKAIIKLPYFPPNLTDLNVTINKINSLVIFT